MKNKRIFTGLFAALLIAVILPMSAFANSSWVWISETRPYDVLPWVILITLAIETAALNYIPKIHKLPKVLGFVTLANLCSFGAPYLLNFLAYTIDGFGFEKYLEHWPSYAVGAIYLGATILIEGPILYYAFKKDSKSSKNLITTIVVMNVVTTVIVAVIERIFCPGHW